MIRFILSALASLAMCGATFAQVVNPGIQQDGIVTFGHGVKWGPGIGQISDSGSTPGDVNGVSLSSSNMTVTGSPCTVGDCAFTANLPALITGASVGSATASPVVTFDNFGRATAISSATVTPAWTSITGKSVVNSEVSASAAIALSKLQGIGANTIVGALTATTPSALAVPSCSTSTSALTWASGAGFGCNSIASGATANVLAFGAVGYAPVSGSCASGAAAGPDDTAELTAAINAGFVVQLNSNRCYKITSTVVGITSNSGLICASACGIYMPAANFNNTDPTCGSPCARYASNAVGISIQGLQVSPFTPLSNVTFKGITIQSEVQQGRVLRGLLVRNLNNAQINDNELYGFPVGIGIAAASLGPSFGLKSQINNNYIHDFADNSTGWAMGVFAQITAIEVDNDRTNNAASTGLDVNGNRINSIRPGPAAIAAYGDQSDGINVVFGTTFSTYLSVQFNTILDTGEGIDFQGQWGNVSNNIVVRSYNFCIKLIHGASFNVVNSNVMQGCGLAGLVVSGAAQADTDGNTFQGNLITLINYNSAWNAAETAAILVSDNSPTYAFMPRNNSFIGNTTRPGAGKWNILRQSHGSNNIFIWNPLQTLGVSGAYVNVNNESGVVQFAGSSTNQSTFSGTVAPQTFTVATLPTGQSAGAQAAVTDATTCAYNGTLTGGGSAFCPVTYTGTAWKSF